MVNIKHSFFKLNRLNNRVMKKTLLLFFLLLTGCLIVNCHSVLAQSNTVKPTTVTLGQSTTFVFNNSFLNLTGLTSNYSWNFGDSSAVNSTATPTISYTYNTTGLYVIAVNVTGLPNFGSNWNVSSDWTQNLGSYSTTILVSSLSTDDGTMGLAIVALLMAVALPITFYVLSKSRHSEV